MSVAEKARRIYEAWLRSKWDAYRHITVTCEGVRVIERNEDGAIAAAHAGDVTRLVDCLRGRKPLTGEDCIAFVAFVETKVPWRWPRWRWLADALCDQTENYDALLKQYENFDPLRDDALRKQTENFDALADFIEKIGRRPGRPRDVGVHAATRLAEVLMTVGLHRDTAIKRACEIVGEEAGAPIDLERVRKLLNLPMRRRRVF